ncbi:hypothetical protein [uncultured Rikenella sp.]|uniref:hypothetical protein n=1 Tax=uncultured Rikenella sp. TaxID=368003 RepID=UPI0025EDAA7B|nr:hypothetical protein [uncultured Rikenella sp.]
MPSGTAPGYRHRSTGILSSVGNNGFNWSGTPVTGNVTVWYLDFNMESLTTSYSYYRARGYQLRCLSE